MKWLVRTLLHMLVMEWVLQQAIVNFIGST